MKCMANYLSDDKNCNIETFERRHILCFSGSCYTMYSCEIIELCLQCKYSI